jgi:ferritin-like metal-binding protein YciE
MSRSTLHDLFVHALSDVYSAEKQLAKALPKMARAASAPELKNAFEHHLEETHTQVDRIDRIVESSGIKLKRMKCAAMEGLVEEGEEVVVELDRGPVLDAALIGAAQKVEHYEIATYGFLCALAKQLKLSGEAKLLAETLAEESATDKKLTELSGPINQAAWTQDDAAPTPKARGAATHKSAHA